MANGIAGSLRQASFRAAATTVVVLTSLALASPPEAKGEGFIVISGPGIARSIRISSPADVSTYWWLTGIGELYRDHAPPATTVLGPRYRVRVVSRDEGPEAIVQDLYPAASDGVIWTYIPRGQRWADRDPAVLPGWWGTVNWQLSELLSRLGFQSLGSFDPPHAAVEARRLG